MRVVIDTNVLLSALISPHSTSDTIYRAWRENIERTRILAPAAFCLEVLKEY